MRMTHIHFDNIFIFSYNKRVATFPSLDANPSLEFSIRLHQFETVP